jgi:protein-L-isoaspartate(D-aspartate) O-methyltransferase
MRFTPGDEGDKDNAEDSAMVQRRERMVREQLQARGIRNPLVLDAMRRVPREVFVAPSQADAAYDDCPLPIGYSQTISQPYVVAWMVELLELRGGETVLEIGCGSGYAAAVLACIAAQVVTVERLHALAEDARTRLERLGMDNVQVVEGDGSLGYPDRAPYDAIAVAAGAPSAPPALLRQLVVGGRLVVPLGQSRVNQRMIRVTRRSETEYETEDLGGVRFVPLIGSEGWS